MWRLETFYDGDWMVTYTNDEGECWCHLGSWFNHKSTPWLIFRRTTLE